MAAAIKMGAKSLVILDAGENCHRLTVPNNVADMFISTISATLRQRVRVEAPAIASQHPVLYLPTPCPTSSTLLNFTEIADLMLQAHQIAQDFMDEADIPIPGQMSGAPHHHNDIPIHQLTHFAKA